jgi:hypothetical protein
LKGKENRVGDKLRRRETKEDRKRTLKKKRIMTKRKA